MKRKVLATLLASAMVATALVGCGETTESGTPSEGGDTSTEAEAGDDSADASNEEVTVLTYYYPDDLTAHTEVVWDVLNDYLREKINVEIDYKPVSWGDYGTKTNTIKSSGEAFDIMFESGTYLHTVNQGFAMPITQYLDTAGADMKATLPSYVWDAATINGEVYGVPTYKDNAVVYSVIYNKTLADEIGLDMPETMDISTPTLNTLFREAEAKLVETFGEDHGYTVTNYNTLTMSMDDLASRLAVTNIVGDETFAIEDGVVVNPYAQPEMQEYYQIMSDLVKDGIVPMDARVMDLAAVKADGTFLMEVGLGYVSFPVNGWSENYETAIVLPETTYITTQYSTFGTTIVGANSENPEKAVEFINLLNTDNFVANTIRFGVEGEYYTVTDADRLSFADTLNADPGARTYYKWYGWQFGNIFAMTLPEQEADDLFEKLVYFNDTALPSNMGFVFNTEPVINEITACTAIRTEYEINLEQGLITDVEANMAEFNQRLKDAGVDAIVAEAQAQLDAWKATQ